MPNRSREPLRGVPGTGPVGKYGAMSSLLPSPGTRLLLVGVLGATTMVATAGAQTPATPVPPAPWTVADRGPAGTVVAGLRIAPTTGATPGPRLTALIRRWGAPASSRAFSGGDACIVTWSRPRIQAVLAKFDRRPGDPGACRPAVGLLQRLQTLGASWRTAEGLAIGASRARLKALYPRATSAAEGDPGILALQPNLHPCRPCSSPRDLARSQRGSVVAFIPRAKVTRLVVQVGAADD